MKALTIFQPWASAIAIGAKRIETRSWSTSYRGPIAIHAGKRRITRELRDLQENSLVWQAVFWRWTDRYEDALPFGTFVAVADLVGCCRTEDLVDLVDEPDFWDVRQAPGCQSYLHWYEDDLGNYSPGRYGWILDNVRPLAEPIPYRGQQGLWSVPEGVLL